MKDAKSLTKPERDALMAVHAKVVRCRQPTIDYDNRYATWELPYWQAYFAKIDAIIYKLAAGEITVGEGNKLTLQTQSEIRAAAAQGQAQATAVAQAEASARAQALGVALIQAGQQIQRPPIIVSAPPPRAPLPVHCTSIGMGNMVKTNCY